MLQANLSLNPSALLPGASRPGKRVEARGTVEEAASFDEPVQTPMLHSVSKVGLLTVSTVMPMLGQHRYVVAMSQHRYMLVP